MTENRTNKWAGFTSSYQHSDQFKIQDDVSYSPKYRHPLDLGSRHLSDGVRLLKRRKIIDLARKVVGGELPTLQSVLGDRDSLDEIVKKHLRDRGESTAIERTRRQYPEAWLEIESQDVILDRITNAAPLVDETVLTAHANTPRQVKQASTKTRHRKKLSSRSSIVAQQTLTKTFRGAKSKTLSLNGGKPDSSPIFEAHLSTKSPADALQANVLRTRVTYVDAKSSPFLFHKKDRRFRKAPVINMDAKEDPITEHAHEVFERSVIDKTSLQPGGALLSNVPHTERVGSLRSSPPVIELDVTQHNASHAAEILIPEQFHMTDTQVMVAEAQDALYSSQPPISSPLDRVANKTPSAAPYRSVPAVRSSTKHADTQAMLNAWTPWSAQRRASIEKQSTMAVAAPTGSAEDSGLVNSFSYFMDDAHDHTRVRDSFPGQTDSHAGHENVISPVAQPNSSFRAQEELAIDNDINEIARALMD